MLTFNAPLPPPPTGRLFLLTIIVLKKILDNIYNEYFRE